MRFLVPICLLSILAACAVRAPAAPPPRPPTAIHASVGETWDAVIDVFADRTIPIRGLDRLSGLIAADMIALDAARASTWADCGGSFGIRDPATHATLNVVVRGDSTTASVRVTANWVRLTRERPRDRAADPDRECATRNVLESEIETAVRARAEQRAGA